jgi:transcriptional regulator with XRE-family HTH domain
MLNLRERRLELGLTMLEVAQAVGVSEAAISRYENGHIKNMGRDKITNYAKILQVEPNCIIGDGISVGIGDDNEGETWTSAEEEQEIDFDMSYQRFKALLRERKQHEERLIEINTELLMYQDACHCILMDLKTEGLTDESR